MAQCEGTTKAGTRCRRQAGEGSSFCVSHGAERPQESSSATAGNASEQSGRAKHPLENAAIVGIVAIGLLALRRVIRLF